MYHRISGTHGYVKLDTKMAWEMIRQIIESGQESFLRRSFKLSL